MAVRDYIRKRKNAFRYAGRGVLQLVKNEAHARIHLLATVCVIVAGLIFDVSDIEWCIIILCIGAVFTAEGFNTAIEKLADRVTTDRDPLIGAAKDIAAGAVLIAAIAAVAAGLIIFLPKFF